MKRKKMARSKDFAIWLSLPVAFLVGVAMEIYNLRIHTPSIDIAWIQMYLIAMLPWNGWVFLAPSLILANSKPLPIVLICYVLFSSLMGISATIISFEHYSIGRMIKGAITWLIIYSAPLATSLVIIAAKRKLYKLENG